MSEWQPIETAPKDGQVILGYYPVGGLEQIRTIYWSGWGGGIWACGGTSHNITSKEPTHWMHLPYPPRGDQP